ncbi:hypothetical protein DVH24_039429 [Malus domestica]|uniref:Uncharacterized protein n=1 Tax=Malus domestica TaxID=3750 RepID=A0A498HY29_MALDO|nr:hypothetical protein DVH24_039429 [Malus domestica]
MRELLKFDVSADVDGVAKDEAAKIKAAENEMATESEIAFDSVIIKRSLPNSCQASPTYGIPYTGSVFPGVNLQAPHTLALSLAGRCNDEKPFLFDTTPWNESRSIDVALLEEQVHQMLREWKAELNEPSSASSFQQQPSDDDGLCNPPRTHFDLAKKAVGWKKKITKSKNNEKSCKAAI